jgi:uncharacterized protein YndB with AHSA1/START domain
MGSESMTTLTLPSDTELVLMRTFDAPRELVWKAFTDSSQLPKWWELAAYLASP